MNAAKAVMVAVLLINSGCFRQLSKRFAAQLFEAFAILLLSLRGRGSAASDCLAAAGHIGVHLAAELQSKQTLYRSHVAERASHVTVMRIAFLILGNRGGEMINGLLIAPLAASDTPV